MNSTGSTAAPDGSDGPLRLDADLDLDRFRRALEDAGFTESALATVLRPVGPSPRSDVRVVRRRAASSSPFHCLARLFVVGDPVERTVLDGIWEERLTDQLGRSGLLVLADGRARSAFKMLAYDPWYVLRDFEPDYTGKPCAADHVLGVGAASVTLSQFTVRRPCGSALDLGTGAGFQAMMAGRHARRVCGTDTNPRALNLARFNAALNGIGNVAYLPGSFYEPVAGRRFDLVVSNPPFVISPESKYIYRDGGLEGDEVSRRVVCGVGDHLEPEGFAVFMVNWCHRDEGQWADTPRSWVEQTGTNGWVLCFETRDVLTYAAKWIQTSESVDRTGFETQLDAWLAYYRELGVDCISSGMIILQRPAGAPSWIRAERIDGGDRSGACGPHIERVFAAENYLRSLPDPRALLDDAFRLCPEHVLEHRLRVQDGRWSYLSQKLLRTEGLGFAGNLDLHMAALLEQCDGNHPLRELIAMVAGRVEQPAEEVTPVVLDAVSKLLRAGLLVRGGNGGAPP
jgi:methylase of polypeptide subunit release factors